MKPRKPGSRVRRQRVTLRAKVRKKKSGSAAKYVLAAAAAAAVLGGARFALARVEWPSLKGHESFAVRKVEVRGELGSLAPALRAHFKDLEGRQVGFFEPGRAARTARRTHPALERVAVRRDWIEKTIVFEASVRPALAEVVFEDARESVPRFLGFDGEMFSAPRGMYDGLPKLEVPAAYRRQLETESARVAGFLRGWQDYADARLGEMRAVRFAGMPEGLALDLRDGTRIFWGELGNLKDKVRRVAQAVEIHRLKYAGRLDIDLRNFLDGKIYVRTPEEAG